MANITPQQLNGLLTQQIGLILLDVRSPVEFDTVHVPQARNVPLDELQPQSFLQSNPQSKDQPVYLICHSGTRAQKAAARFAGEGYPNTVVVEGGTQAWEAAGLPVTRGATKVISLERQVRIAAGSLVFSGVLLSYFVHPGFIWLSGFVGAGLVFAGITDFCGMGLLLAKLPWNKRKA